LWEVEPDELQIPKLIAEGAKLATDAYQLYVGIGNKDWPLVIDAGLELALNVILLLKKMGWEPEDALEELRRRLGL